MNELKQAIRDALVPFRDSTHLYGELMMADQMPGVLAQMAIDAVRSRATAVTQTMRAFTNAHVLPQKCAYNVLVALSPTLRGIRCVFASGAVIVRFFAASQAVLMVEAAGYGGASATKDGNGE